MALIRWFTPRRCWVIGIALVAGLAILLLPWTTSSGRTFSNVMAILELAVIAFGLCSLLLVAEQIQQTAKWNKLLSYHQFFGDLITTEMVKDMLAVAETCGFKEAMNSVQPMSLESRRALEDDLAAVKTVAAYLDEFEEFCAAVQAGVTDQEYAYTLEATRVIRAWTVFAPFIQSQRASLRFSRCYLELERIGGAWRDRRETETKQKYAQDGVQQHV